MKIKVMTEKEARYLRVTVPVRYDDEDMPFDAPKRKGDVWEAIIDLDERRVIDWPEGQALSFKDMKLCDEGRYFLLDADMKEIAKIDGYVPNRLLPGSYGDYLSLTINESGFITNWLENANFSDFEGNEI